MRRLILIPVVAVLMALIPAGGAWAAPAVTISPNQVAAGQNIMITGSGFSPGSSVIINWCFDGSLPEFPIVDDSGNFTLTVHIPTNAPTGPTCIDLPSSSLKVNFTITVSPAPTPTPNPSALPEDPPSSNPPVELGPFEPNTDPAQFGLLITFCLQEQLRSPTTLGPACASLIAQGLGVIIRFGNPLPAE